MSVKPVSLYHEDDYDEVDRKIDATLGRIGSFIRFLITVAVIAGIGYIVYSNWDSWSSAILFGAYLIFQLFFAIMFMIVQFAALFWFLGRTRVYWIMPGETGVGFRDYRGNPEVLEVARRVVTLLRGVKAFRQMGGQVHRGLLLSGPPGTGKSYLAQCIATEAGVPFCYASAPSFQNMFMGIGNVRVMMLYSKARKLAQKYGACIIFIDEIDAIGASRSGQQQGFGLMGMGMGGGSGLLNELLMQMDPPPSDQNWKARLLRRVGLRTKKAEMPAVLTMGATNLVNVLDAALLRPGRFDWKLKVDAPDFNGRKEVLDYYLSKVSHDPNLDYDRLSSEMIGYTPVEIKFVINEAVVVSHFAGRDTVTYDDLREAREMREWGLRQPIRSMNREDKRRLAYHETGHALVMAKLLPRERLEKVTIIRHGDVEGALGFAVPKPKEEIYTMTKDELLAHIQVSLGSRAAEQLFLGIEMTGASGDLQNATRLAGAYIAMYGMHGSLYSNLAFNEMQPDARTKREIERILDQQFAKVKAFLDQHHDEVVAIAEELLEKEDLTGDDVMAILGDVEQRKRIAAANGPANGSAGALIHSTTEPAL